MTGCRRLKRSLICLSGDNPGDLWAAYTPVLSARDGVYLCFCLQRAGPGWRRGVSSGSVIFWVYRTAGSWKGKQMWSSSIPICPGTRHFPCWAGCWSCRLRPPGLWFLPIWDSGPACFFLSSWTPSAWLAVFLDFRICQTSLFLSLSGLLWTNIYTTHHPVLCSSVIIGLRESLTKWTRQPLLSI